MRTPLFILPGNDIEDHTDAALELLVKYDLSTPTTGPKYFNALTANGAPYTPYIKETFVEIGMTLTVGAEPLMQSDNYISIINMVNDEDSDPLFIPEYCNHYESIFCSVEAE